MDSVPAARHTGGVSTAHQIKLSPAGPGDGRSELAQLPEVRVAGVSVFDPVWSQRWHKSVKAELISVVRGRFSLVFEHRRFPMKAGDLALIPPGMTHRDAFDLDDEPELFYAHFSWAASDLFFTRVTNERLRKLPEHRLTEARRLVLRLRDHGGVDSELNRTIARALLHVLLLELWSAVDAPAKEATGDRQHDLMIRARQYLDAHYSEPISLERMARHLHVSPYHLSRVFSRESGFSLTAYLTSVRMAVAHERLRARAGNVSEIAYAVGYESSAYFSRVFKRHFGCPPSSVRPEAAPVRR